MSGGWAKLLHWDAIGAGCRDGDSVHIVGTSTCIIAMAEQAGLVRGVCGVVPGSVDPKLVEVEAGWRCAGLESSAYRPG